MLQTTTLLNGPVSVVEYRCTAGPAEWPFVEHHQSWSVSYVQHGSFDCECRGASFELVAGSVLLGRPGDAYMCTHDHHAGGDECLAFHVEPQLADEIGGRHGVWRSGDTHCAADVDLQHLAGQAGLSVFHYLRVFASVLGVTPHPMQEQRRVVGRDAQLTRRPLMAQPVNLAQHEQARRNGWQHLEVVRYRLQGLATLEKALRVVCIHGSARPRVDRAFVDIGGRMNRVVDRHRRRHAIFAAQVFGDAAQQDSCEPGAKRRLAREALPALKSRQQRFLDHVFDQGRITQPPAREANQIGPVHAHDVCMALRGRRER